MLELERFEESLATRIIGRSRLNELWDTIDSTNNRVAVLARQGADEGLVVFARSQTAGRGRLGRRWVSPPGSGLYMSLLLRPDKKIGEIAGITLAIGVAAARAILAESGVKVGLKWVNDLIFDGKKLGGILVETLMNEGERGAIIIGLGVNTGLKASDLPDDLKSKVISLDQATGTICDTNTLAAEICLQIECAYDKMLSGRSREVLDEWRAFSVTLGQEVMWSTPARNLHGIAIDITDSGSLIVETTEGRQEIFGGEISLRLGDGSYA